MTGWNLPPGCTDKDIDDAAPQNEPESEWPDDIITSHVFPPIPLRQFDWSAARDGYEPGNLMGWGPTEADAVSNLLELERERDEVCCDICGKPIKSPDTPETFHGAPCHATCKEDYTQNWERDYEPE